MARIVGVNLGGMLIHAGIVVDGTVQGHKECPTQADREGDAVVADTIALIGRLLREEGLSPKDIDGVGVGVPSPVSADRRIPIAPPYVVGLKGIPVAERVAEPFNWPWALENDANAATLAERLYGAGRGVDDLVLLTLSTGVGGGVITGGRLLRGPVSAAAELGHIVVEPNGRVCRCGQRGCLEAQVAIDGLLERGRALCPDLGDLDAETGPGRLAEAARHGHASARRVFDEMGYYLGMGIADLLHVFNPDLVVLSGSLSEELDLFEGRMRETVKENYRVPALIDRVRIVASALGEHGGILGAAAVFADAQAGARSPYAIAIGRGTRPDLVLAVQIGASRVQSAVVDRSGKIEGKPVVFPYANSDPRLTAAAIYGRALEAADQAAEKASHPPSVVVVIVPAGVRRGSGAVLSVPGIPALSGTRLPEAFRRWGGPVFIENDANCALLFEQRFGVARNLRSVLGVHLVYGLGGALIVDDRLIVGRNGHAVEIGHIPINAAQGRNCPCGNYDCLERYASGAAVWRDAKDRENAPTYTGARIPELDGNYMDVLYAAQAGHPMALEVIRSFGEYLARGMVPLMNTFDPEAVIFTGVLSKASDYFLEIVRETVGTRCFPDIGVEADLRISSDPAFGALRGSVVVANGVPVEF